MSHVFNDPCNKKLYAAAQAMDLPDFVKEAAAAEEQDFTKVSSDQFGDPSRRIYPCNTKANTWLSVMNFVMDKQAMPKGKADYIGSRLLRYSDFWGLSAPTVQQEKTAAAAPTYQIPLTVKDTVVHTVIINDAQQYKEAADHLYNNRTKFTYDMRRQMARGIIHAPASVKCELPDTHSDYIEKAAGFGMADRTTVGNVVISRVILLGNKYPEYSKILTKYAMEQLKDINPTVLQKTAALIDLVDRAANLQQHYGKALSTPEESLFPVIEKHAAEIVNEVVILQNGKAANKPALKNQQEKVASFFNEYYGEVPYRSVDEMISTVASLPRPDADAFVNITGLAQ